MDRDAVEAWTKASCSVSCAEQSYHNLLTADVGNMNTIPILLFSIASLSKTLVFEPIPRSQHRPVGITVILAVILAVSTASAPNCRCFNLKKTNWEEFSHELEHRLQELERILDDYDQFSEIVRRTARRSIPRGCNANYILGLTPTTRRMVSTYKHLYERDPFSPTTIVAGKRLLIPYHNIVNPLSKAL